MVKRSLRASPVGIQRAEGAFAFIGWTQENLAGEVNLKTRQPIWRFFAGQPVDRQVFIEICAILDLDWRETTLGSPIDFSEPGETPNPSALEELEASVQQVRSHHHDTIQDQCGILQLLDISRPVSLDDIYVDVNVDVNILEDIASQQQLEIADLQRLDPSDFNRVSLGAVEQKQIPGMQAVETYSKLRVLGRPGCGKTTFLKHLALQCNRGEFSANQVPIFIYLREFAEEANQREEFSLFNTIHQVLLSSGASNPAVLENLLQEGRILLLMDGMDEVLNHDIAPVLKEIRKFSDKYHKNRFVASCRTAAQKLRLRGFTDVEIAPFTEAQIATFAHKWFVALTKTTAQAGIDLATQFIQQVNLPEHWQFRQLVVTPLFLHLACWIFNGREKFPTKRTEFYKQGLDLLLGKWDEARGVERDDVYRGFLLPQKLKTTPIDPKLATARAFYLALSRSPHLAANFTLVSTLDQGMFLDAALENLMQEFLSMDNEDVAYVNACTEALNNILIIVLDAGFYKSLQELKDQLSSSSQNHERLQDWWQENYAAWVSRLKSTIAQYRNIHHPWQFTSEQQQVLQRYYDANQLLIDCLNSNCEVTAAIRQDIEATLLLPQQEMEDREWQGD